MTRGVYCITAPTGRFYIGCSKNIENRWYGHTAALNKGKHQNRQLQYAWKRGGEGWSFTILEIVPNDTCYYEREAYWIHRTDATRKGFNIAEPTGRQAALGLPTNNNKKPKEENYKQNPKGFMEARAVAFLREHRHIGTTTKHVKLVVGDFVELCDGDVGKVTHVMKDGKKVRVMIRTRATTLLSTQVTKIKN